MGTHTHFSALETLNVAYDSAGRRIRQSFVTGGATHAVTQYSYNAASLLECVAVRMNPAEFGSLPSSACTLDTEGSNGPDRITRYTYDVMAHVTNVASAYGTPAQQNTLVQYFFNNGMLVTSQDANGNMTTYEYDGFDRIRKIRFPNTSSSGSSTTDYEQYTYDANSNVTQDRRRDGATISYAYDNLNRASTMTPSTGSVVSYSYDNFSRMTQAAYSGHTLTRRAPCAPPPALARKSQAKPNLRRRARRGAHLAAQQSASSFRRRFFFVQSIGAAASLLHDAPIALAKRGRKALAGARARGDGAFARSGVA